MLCRATDLTRTKSGIGKTSRKTENANVRAKPLFARKLGENLGISFVTYIGDSSRGQRSSDTSQLFGIEAFNVPKSATLVEAYANSQSRTQGDALQQSARKRADRNNYREKWFCKRLIADQDVGTKTTLRR